MVFLAWEIDCSIRPIDGFGGEDGDVSLTAAQMPQKLIKGQFLGVLFSANDLSVLFLGDGLLRCVPNLGPLAARNDRDSKIAHIEGEVVEPP